MAPLIVMLVVWLIARAMGATGLWLQADSWTGALRCPGGDVCVHSDLALPSPHAAGPDRDGAGEPARSRAPRVGNRRARASRCNRADGTARAARGGVRPDRAARRDVSCERSRRTRGTHGRRPARDAASLASAAAAVLDGRSVVGSVATAQSLTTVNHQSGRDFGSPNHGSTLLSKRVKAEIRSPVSVRTNKPVPCRMPPVAARR
jgi:hypothetical protein